MAAHLHARTDGRVKLVPQQGTQLAGLGPRHIPFNQAWSQWQSPQDVEKEWPTILGHLLEVVKVTPPGRPKEGRIQASLTRLATDFAIVDREVVLSHQNEGQRSAVRAGLRGSVDQVLAAATDVLPPSRPKSFGNKLDALGIDKQGRLLVIEVKPASELNGTAWTPLQVSVYQHLFSAWLKSAPADAVTVISGMLDDRVRLGLLDAGVRKSFKLKPELEPRPVIALGTDQHHRLDLLYGRFRAVLKACQAGGAPLAELAVWSVGAKSIDDHPKLP